MKNKLIAILLFAFLGYVNAVTWIYQSTGSYDWTIINSPALKELVVFSIIFVLLAIAFFSRESAKKDMDLTVLFRVVWQPKKVFHQFVGKTRVEPFIFVVLYVVGSYLWYKKDLIRQPVLFLINLLDGFSVALLFPVLNATLSYLLVRYCLKHNVRYMALVSVFILCALPYFIEGLLTAGFGYRHTAGVGYLVELVGLRQPFLVGMATMISPFFVWIVFLWWIALNQLINLQRRQGGLLIGSLIVVNLLISGAWRQIKHMTA